VADTTDMSNADRITQPIPTASITITTTPEKLERWRAFAAERGIDDVELWLEILAENALALAAIAHADAAL
jgi:hypothetical protein